MFRAVTVINDRGDALRLDIFNPYATGVNVIDIDGIGPGKASISAKELYGKDGSIYNSARIESRSIDFKFELVDSVDIETTRQNLYKFFPLKRQVTLFFETDRRESYIVGNVETNHPLIFREKEEVAISVLCTDPYFYRLNNPGEGTVLSTYLTGGFTFPFNNPVDTSSLEFGKVTARDIVSVDYDGESETGIFMKLRGISSDVIDPYILNTTSGQGMYFNTNPNTGGIAFAEGDVLEINTVPGSKGATLVKKNGSRIPFLNAFKPNTAWISLLNGQNDIRFGATSGWSNIALEVQYATRYLGV